MKEKRTVTFFAAALVSRLAREGFALPSNEGILALP